MRTERTAYATIHEYIKRGVKDEDFIRIVTEESLGGKTKPSSKKDNIYKHIDFWWDSPKMGRIGIDAKGIKKNKRSDTEVDDTINWIEVMGCTGKPGWIYGEAAYIAFRTKTDIIFVKREKLVEMSNRVLQGKQLVRECPNEFYIPYRRKDFGGVKREDVIYKCPTSDLRNLSEDGGFIINLKD